jgi:hypothetical protein
MLTCDSCFPHIINLAAQEFIEALKYTPASGGINGDLLRSVRSDVVTRCRELIVACRLTSLRREEFRRTISEMNRSGSNVPTLALVYDVVTRWSATFHMIDRFLLMHSVCCSC